MRLTHYTIPEYFCKYLSISHLGSSDALLPISGQPLLQRVFNLSPDFHLLKPIATRRVPWLDDREIELVLRQEGVVPSTRGVILRAMYEPTSIEAPADQGRLLATFGGR